MNIIERIDKYLEEAKKPSKTGVKKGRFKPPYRVDTWFERDRASVVVYDANDKIVAEWWDEEIGKLVDDGFLDPKDWKGSAIEYLEYLKII